MNRGKLKPKRLELANERDLARILIENPGQPSLKISSHNPRLDEPITVYGNSQGSGAITKLSGVVQAAGPDVLEVSAQFVSGNSGSPILSVDGSVLGVATFLTIPGKSNWMTKGTRFEETRHFGVRLTDDITWIPVSTRRFYHESSTLLDFDTFLNDSSEIFLLLDDSKFEDLGQVVSRQSGGKTPRYYDSEYSKLIKDLCNNITSAVKTYDNGHSIRSFSASIPLRNAERTFQQFPQHPLKKLRRIRWSTRYYKDMASEYETIFSEWK